MTTTSEWMDTLRSLSPEDSKFLELLFLGATEAELQAATGEESSKTSARIASVLELGPFDSDEECRTILSSIYAEYCHNPAEDQSDFQQAPRKTRKSAGRVRSHGVLFDLPEDIVSMDVITGVVPRSGIDTDEVRQAIADRRARRLTPTYLMLTPVPDDPDRLSYQLVFIEHGP